MCTLSVLPLANGHVRWLFNRDEDPRRPAGEAPQLRRSGGQEWLAPRDPRSGGTWLAVNQSGLFFALLNKNDTLVNHWQAPRGAARSRGEVIPAVITERQLAGLAAALPAVLDGDLPPFRLLASDGAQVVMWDWNGAGALSQERAAVDRPRLWCSSGLGDQRVAGPRQQRFAELVEPVANAQAQDRFHADRCGDDSAAWVAMRRPDARTVSRLSVVHKPQVMLMTYDTLDDEGQVQLSHSAQLALLARA